MALINKQEVIKELIDGLRLDTIKEKIPSEVADKILPTFQVNPRPRIILIDDVVANNSDKTFTVPTGKKWKILYGAFILATTATAGNRQLQILVRATGTNTIYLINAANVQIASTTETYNLGQFGDVFESVAGVHMLPIPVNLILSEGFTFRVLDSAGIAAAADDLTIRFMVEESDMNAER